MQKYFIIPIIFIIFFGCGRVGDEASKLKTLGAPAIDSGDIIFDIKSKSQLVDKNGNSYVDKGHYSLLAQSKDREGRPIGNLQNITYEIYENNSNTASSEAKVILDKDSRVTTNNILLLLDFSGSLISDCGSLQNELEKDKNLCYQLVESAKTFIDNTVNENQNVAIYYFNSKTTITALVTSRTSSATNNKSELKDGLNQLYDPTFRRTELEGFSSTNLNGAVIEATKVACQWVGNCNYDNYSPQNNGNLEHFEFASIVVFTDGRDSAEIVSESKMFDFMNAHKGLYYYTIGLGNVDTRVLSAIGRDKYIPVSQNSELDGAFDDLSLELSDWGDSFYKIDYCPATQEGAVDIRIKVSSEGRIGIISDNITLPENIDFRCDL